MAYTVYYRTHRELEGLREGLKLRACPFCGVVGRLNRHSFVHDEARRVVGQRVFCNGRSGGAGCSRTFRLLQCRIFSNHQITLAVLWRYVQGLMAGKRKSTAFRDSGCCLHSSAAYRLYRRLWERQTHLRTRLLGAMPTIRPPTAEGVLVQTLVHLVGLFQNASLPLADYQHRFQESFL